MYPEIDEDGYEKLVHKPTGNIWMDGFFYVAYPFNFLITGYHNMFVGCVGGLKGRKRRTWHREADGIFEHSCYDSDSD